MEEMTETSWVAAPGGFRGVTTPARLNQPRSGSRVYYTDPALDDPSNVVHQATRL